MRTSIIIAAYNAQNYLIDTIQSIQRQTTADWELLIVDDGSQDLTVATAQAFARRDARIRVVSQAHGGVDAARNTGFAAANVASEFLVYMDADDIWEPNALRALMATLESHPDAVAAYGLAYYMDADGQPYGGSKTAFNTVSYREVDFDQVSQTFQLPPGTYLLRRWACETAGLFDAATLGCDDWDFWLRLSLYGTFAPLPEIVIGYRRHDANLTNNRRLGELGLERFCQKKRSYEIARTVGKIPPAIPPEGDNAESENDNTAYAGGPDSDDHFVPKLCFSMCLDTNFIPGALATIRSIRRFYSPDEADIIVFLDQGAGDQGSEEFAHFCTDAQAELRHFEEIWGWLKPLVYDDPRYSTNIRHFYHPDFRLPVELEHSAEHFAVEHSAAGFNGLRHLHPLNVRAYSTGYCLCIRNYRQVVHIDADAFLLARIDVPFERHNAPDTVIAFDDGVEALENLDILFGEAKPEGLSDTLYAFNAGLVFYTNGPGVKRLMRDFMFYIESCHHYTHAGGGADQGVLRALVAIHHFSGRINFYLEEATNWNPTFRRAEDLRFDESGQRWINEDNGRTQHIWHGAGRKKLWFDQDFSSAIHRAWQWAGGSSD